MLRSKAVEGGLLYWLGLCQALIAHLVECRPAPAEAAAQLADMLVLGLTGLGIEATRAIAAAQAGTGGSLEDAAAVTASSLIASIARYMPSG